MILTTARLEVRERIGELSADFFTDVEVDRAINDAQKHFSIEERWPWLFTEGSDSLSEDEDELELPQNVSVNRGFVLSVSGDSLTQPRPLERVSPEAGFRLRFISGTRTGVPQFYYLTRATIESGATTYVMKLVPPCDGEYDFEYLYIRTPDDVANPGDYIDVPDEYCEAVPAWAAGKLFLKEFQVSQKAGEQFALYQDILAKAREEVFTGNVDEIVAMGREHPGESGRLLNEYDYVMGRIPPTLGG